MDPTVNPILYYNQAAVAWSNSNVYMTTNTSRFEVFELSLFDTIYNTVYSQRSNSAGMWQDYSSVWQVVATDGGACTFSFNLGGGNYSDSTGDDLEIDPESIAVVYIPATAAGTEVPTIAEQRRMFRKIKAQITSAPVASAALPTRTPIAWGALGQQGPAFSIVTATVTPTPIASFAVPEGAGGLVAFDLLAIFPTTPATQSSFSCSFNVWNTSGTATGSSVRTIDSFQLGVGYPAAAAPVTLTFCRRRRHRQRDGRIHRHYGLDRLSVPRQRELTMTEAYLSLGQQNAGQGSYLVQTGTPASSILVTAVSQNAGTINGGSAVTVYGENFLVGMTSTLGTVTKVAGGTATITTSSHAAGAVSWTLTNTDGSTSSSQTFTYLAHPGTPSISPSSGPDNATQAVTVTSSALPYGFTGVPFSITVGGLSLTSLTATASTTATGTIPSGGADGTADVVVHVDGVSATASGIYTFAGAPTITKIDIDFASANGGESRTITGTGLSSATVKVDGVSATITGNTSTSVTFTIPASGVDATQGNPTVSTIAITVSGGTVDSGSSPGASLWYVPAYFGYRGGRRLYGSGRHPVGEQYRDGAGRQSGNGYTLSPAGTAPPYSSTGGGTSGTLAYWSSVTGTNMGWRARPSPLLPRGSNGASAARTTVADIRHPYCTLAE